MKRKTPKDNILALDLVVYFFFVVKSLFCSQLAYIYLDDHFFSLLLCCLNVIFIDFDDDEQTEPTNKPSNMNMNMNIKIESEQQKEKDRDERMKETKNSNMRIITWHRSKPKMRFIMYAGHLSLQKHGIQWQGVW